jgi:hypothetical protein
MLLSRAFAMGEITIALLDVFLLLGVLQGPPAGGPRREPVGNRTGRRRERGLPEPANAASGPPSATRPYR